MKTVKQCKSCPWRKSVDPTRDIPNGYSVERHEGLRNTIATRNSNPFGSCVRFMACHYSPVGKEFACAGWLANQLGEGNNIALRMRVIAGQSPVPEVDGEQHGTFEDTLPKKKTRKRVI